MPRGAACLSCHQRKVKCYFQPGTRQCTPCACNGTRCVIFSSRQGQRSGLTTKTKRLAHHSSARTQQPDHRSPVPMQQFASDASGNNDEGEPQSDDDKIEDLFKDQLTRDILHLDSNQAATATGDEEFKGGMWYLGEANFAWLLLNHPQCKHYPVYQTASPTASSLTAQGVAKIHPNPLRSQETQYLESIKALSLPKSPQLEIFVKVFFSQVAPRLPVLSSMSFSLDAINRLIQSPLLIQSMLFASARFLSLDVIFAFGYKDRQDAQNNFYRKAKTLFDFDHEQQQLFKLQSAILLGSEWNVFVNEKDPDEWIGRALRIAHRMGLHRNIRNPSINERTRALYRRIWWTIYKMDRNLTIATGRPSRICDQDCDVPSLSESDFRSFDDFVDYDPHNHSESYHQQKSWINYQLRSCELWRIAGEFTTSNYPASQSSILYYKERSYDKILDDWTEAAGSGPHDARGCSGPWDLNLELLYCFVRCLVNRPTGSTQAPSLEAPGQAMCNAAWKINQLAEQLVLQYSTYPYPYFLPVALKLSTCVFVLQGATSVSRPSRNFALHRVGSAQLTLEEVLKQIPSARRVLRTIMNSQAILENYQARGTKRPRNDSETEMQRGNLTEEPSTLAKNKEVLQEKGPSEFLDSDSLNMPWSDGGEFDFAMFSQNFALDVFDWTPETDDIS